ncbi:hypothetical protein G3572_03105 [Rhodobacter sp. ETT8]|uniref:Tip attachment protein J domain-containing protein n=2 Tax=Pseudotabrizicola algicola TaxID=2709381 RepID=A0A6B3RPZ0_9RHOB|nr:hypothetical protein [Pseudotabrizicola algicola]
MIAALLCSAATLAPARAEAGPLVSAVVSLASSVFGAGGFIATTLAGGGIGAFALRLGGSLLLSAAARALGPKPPGAPELVRQFENPQSLPAKRFVYGETRIYGSPAWRVGGVGPSQGRLLVGCFVLNSRPSDAVTGVYLDKEAVPLSGDLYDFAPGGGASAAAGSRWAPWARFWVGRGDQTSPPADILTLTPGLFSATDAGRGLTVMWVLFDCGPNDQRSWRWPRTPPEVEIEGRWSKVWDLRDVAQDPDDPATWQFSDNQALCALDAARMNPIRRYPLAQIDLATFAEAADIADELVPLKAGGTEPRYRVNGALIFNGSELMDQILPLYAAGAAQPVRVGGRLSIAAGAFTAPVATLTDITEAEGLGVRFLKPGRDLATTVHATFTDPARDYRTSDLEDYTVPGAVAVDGGLPTVVDLELPLVTSATQAMRLQKIRAKRLRAQRQITCTLPPAWFAVVAGCNVTVDFPEPYAALNGLYRVTSANPGLFASEDGSGGVAMRVPVVMEEIAASDFAFDPETEEQNRPLLALSVGRSPPEPGGAITTTTGAAVAIGAGPAAIAAVRFAFDPSPSPSVQIYEWEYRLGGTSNPWQAGGTIDGALRDGGGQVSGLLAPVAVGVNVTIRARAIGLAASDWVVSAPIEPTLDIARYEADFSAGVYRIDGATGTLANVLGLARASVATFVDGAGLIQTAAVNVPRIDHAAGVPCLLIEPAGANAFTWSEAMDNAAWTKTNATVMANAIAAPDGATTADLLVENTATSSHRIQRARAMESGVAATISLFAKAGGRDILRLRASGTGMTVQAAEVQISTGTVSVQAGTPTVETVALAGGWRRITFMFTPNVTVSGLFEVYLCSAFGVSSYTGDGVSGAYLWGAQDGAGSYIATAGAAGSRAADLPAMQGVSGVMDLLATYDNGTTAAFDAAPVLPGYWPTLTRQRLRSLIGTI